MTWGLVKYIRDFIPDVERFRVGSSQKIYGTFILGETINKVEILKYETPYSLVVRDGIRSVQIPKIYQITPSLLLGRQATDP